MSSAVSHPNANATRVPTETAFLARASPTCLAVHTNRIRCPFDNASGVRVLPVPVMQSKELSLIWLAVLVLCNVFSLRR